MSKPCKRESAVKVNLIERTSPLDGAAQFPFEIGHGGDYTSPRLSGGCCNC